MKEKITGREIERQVEVREIGTFSSIDKVQEQLREEGYIVGSMCRDEPIGFAKEDKCECVAKWRNIPKEDYGKLDGIITSNDFREGYVTIIYFKEE